MTSVRNNDDNNINFTTSKRIIFHEKGRRARVRAELITGEAGACRLNLFPCRVFRVYTTRRRVAASRRWLRGKKDDSATKKTS